VLIHGSSASRMVRRLAAGAPASLTVTILDGLVLASSAFEHSANYHSVVLLGTFARIDDDEKLAALETLVEGLVPGRRHGVRHPNRKELKATQVLALPIDEAAVKTRSGPPDDDTSPDAALDVWAAVIRWTKAFAQRWRPVASAQGSASHQASSNCYGTARARRQRRPRPRTCSCRRRKSEQAQVDRTEAGPLRLPAGKEDERWER
jgi:nitroimidazol reductase NimA-like FMN-containing flavoprotein (pyridoxamine 5'-phosphate oxidase superfamily)